MENSFVNDLEFVEESQEYDWDVDSDPTNLLNALKYSQTGQILVTT